MGCDSARQLGVILGTRRTSSEGKRLGVLLGHAGLCKGGSQCEAWQRHSSPARRSTPMPVTRTTSRMIGAAMLAVPLALAVAPTATASAPARIPFTIDIAPSAVNDICSFPVTVSAHIDGVETDFNLHAVFHQTEQDVFSANGHTLTGLPYTYDQYFSATRSQTTGVVEKIPLDNGHLFLAAGRTDLNLPHGDWILVATFGSSPDIGEFCAELS